MIRPCFSIGLIVWFLVFARNSTLTAAPLFNPATSHYYDFVSTPPNTSWSMARISAESLSFDSQQGYLATITSAAEEQFLRNNFGNRSLVWIGGSDAAVEGDWRWVTG